MEEKKESGEGNKEKKSIFKVPDKYNSPNFIIAKLAVVALIASKLSALSGGKVNTLVICLILGILARRNRIPGRRFSHEG